MAESLTIARPYAEAAFKLAREQDAMPSWSDALSRLAAIAADESARALISNPGVSADMVATVLADAAGQLGAEQRNFVRVLAANERLGVLREISGQFEVLRNALEGVVDARVSSAFALSDAQLGEIVATLRAKYGRDVKAMVSVDPELIGGVSIRVGDEVMDASVRSKLAQLAGALRI
ncbi:MAG: F0F1 ATP synthase subunit delta [Burkholderiaceae bacterium]|nr:F0F1 ATP synthase subunit delta [Burkholderiaceae bacterium]